jgi:hypothetical protein
MPKLLLSSQLLVPASDHDVALNCVAQTKYLYFPSGKNKKKNCWFWRKWRHLCLVPCLGWA